MRKNILRTVLAALLLCFLLGAPTAFAEGAVVTGSEVNVRSGPGTNYRIIDCLAKGTVVTVTDRSNGSWYAVSYDGVNGYMSARYLDVQEETGIVLGFASGSGYINSMYVRFRSGPSMESSILGEYNTGKTVTIIGTSGDWTACVIDGREGYVYSSYVTKGSPPSQSEETSADEPPSDGVVIIIGDDPPGGETPDDPGGDQGVIVIVEPGYEEPEPEPTPSPEPSPGVVVIVEPGQPSPSPDPEEPEPTPSPGVVIIVEPGYEEPEPTPGPGQDPSDGPKPGYINGDYVHFRSGPGTDYGILGTYNRGKELLVTGTSGDWTACVIDEVSGYVFSSYVALSDSEGETPDDPDPEEPEPTPTPSPSPTTTPVNDEPGYIVGNNVRLRSAPSMTSDILGELFYGDRVTITGVSGDWTAVTASGKSGYVFSQYVVKGVPETETSSGGTAEGRLIADYALQFVGCSYTWGGSSPSTGFDCSGFTSYVYAHFGYTLNRVAADQARNGRHVDASELQPGDLLCFYSGGSYIGHVGLYIGNNKFVHAANSALGVVVTELSGYYATRGFEARRIID